MVKKTRSIYTIMFTLLSIIMLGSCSVSPKVQKLPEITLAFSSWPGFDVIYYAKAKKLFKKHGISVKFVKYADQESVAKALQNHKVDAAMISIWDAVKLKQASDFSIVLVTNVSAGADGIVAQKAISSIEDLKSKRVSAQLGTVNELILYEALQKHGMDFKDLDLVDLTNDEAVIQLANKDLDAAVLWEPMLSQSSLDIRGNIIHTTKDLDSLVVDVFIVDKQVLSSKKQVIEKYVGVWFELMQILKKNPTELFDVVAQEISSPYFGLDYAGLQAGTLKLNKEMFLEHRLSNTIKKVKSMGKVAKNLPSIDIEDSFVRGVVF